MNPLSEGWCKFLSFPITRGSATNNNFSENPLFITQNKTEKPVNYSDPINIPSLYSFFCQLTKKALLISKSRKNALSTVALQIPVDTLFPVREGGEGENGIVSLGKLDEGFCLQLTSNPTVIKSLTDIAADKSSVHRSVICFDSSVFP